MNRRHGFTLVELLVAVAILGIVAVLGWRGLDSIVRSRQALTATMEQTRGIQLAFAQLQNDLEQRAERRVLHQRDNLMGDGSRLVLVRSVLAEGEPSRLQVVSYRIRDGVLTRRESAATRDLKQLDVLWQAATGDGGGESAPGVALQEGVAGMASRVWIDGAWQNLNGMAPVAAPSPLALIPEGPKGLELSLQLQGQPASLVKIFLLGAQ